MNNLKKYSKPLLISEKFVPNSYCVICDPKTIESYTLSSAFKSYQKFVLDVNENGFLDDVEIEGITINGKKSHQTTDNSWWQHSEDPYTTTVQPFRAWPYDSDPSDARNHEPVWYVTNPGNNSGHIYAYGRYTINYNHS